MLNIIESAVEVLLNLLAVAVFGGLASLLVLAATVGTVSAGFIGLGALVAAVVALPVVILQSDFTF